MEKQPTQFTFSVLRVLDSSFYIEEAIDPKIGEVKIGYGLAVFSNINENWVQFNIKADFTNKEAKMFASNTVVTKFGIVDMKSFVNPDNDLIIWPPNSLETMFGIAFSHLRAIMAKNIGASKFRDYVIPLINPSILFKQLINDNPDFMFEESTSGLISEINNGESFTEENKKNIPDIELAPTKKGEDIEKRLKEAREQVRALQKISREFHKAEKE